MVDIAYLADGSLAVEADDAHLAGGHTHLGVGTRKTKNPTDKFIVKRRNTK